jgi:hypothetical protein
MMEDCRNEQIPDFIVNDLISEIMIMQTGRAAVGADAN